MRIDWHIQDAEVVIRHSKQVAVHTVKTTHDASRIPQSQCDQSALGVDHTHSIDHTASVDRLHDSEKPRRLSAPSIATCVSFH